MDFEEWMAKNYSGAFDMPHPREAYEAGQQSKQAEIDALKMSNHHLSAQVLDAEAYSEHWQKISNKSQAEIDALKAKVNKVLYAISQSELHGDRAVWGIQDEIKEILK